MSRGIAPWLVWVLALLCIYKNTSEEGPVLDRPHLSALSISLHLDLCKPVLVHTCIANLS